RVASVRIVFEKVRVQLHRASTAPGKSSVLSANNSSQCAHCTQEPQGPASPRVYRAWKSSVLPGPCVRQRHCYWARRIIICLPAETMATRAPYGGGGAQAGGAAGPTTMERLKEVEQLLADKKPWPAFLHS
ncbi:unnamed protein product, partial [Ectocarpus sp. 12 AP-2014]